MVVVDPSVTATTERLLIRPLRMEDADDIVLMRSQPDIMKHTPLLPSSDVEVSRAWIQGCLDRDNCWNFVVELLHPSPSSTGTAPRVIGMVGAVRAPEVGYMFNTDYWGKGYATEALKGFMPMFFNHFSGGANQLYEFAEAHTDPELVASQNVLEKAGFRFHEKREKDFDNPILGLRDTFVYRLYRSDAKPDVHKAEV